MGSLFYVACQFRPGDRRSYTYHHREALPVGAVVEVITRDGKVKATVVGCTDSRPTFETKPIAGVVSLPEPEPAPSAEPIAPEAPAEGGEA